MKKFKLKLTSKDVENLEYGLPISNKLIIVLMPDNTLSLQHWSGGGGSYFSDKENEFPGIKGLDIIEISFPNGTKQSVTVPFDYYAPIEEQ